MCEGRLSQLDKSSCSPAVLAFVHDAGLPPSAPLPLVHASVAAGLGRLRRLVGLLCTSSIRLGSPSGLVWLEMLRVLGQIAESRVGDGQALQGLLLRLLAGRLANI